MNSFDVIWSKHSYSGPGTLTLVQALLLWFKYQDDPVLLELRSVELLVLRSVELLMTTL